MCELCEAVDDITITKPKVWNTLIFETQNFVVTPSIGPIIEGQIMITSKKHFPCLLSMGSEKITELTDLVTQICSVYKEDILFTEHGSFNGQKGGACIEHTHIHVLPTLGNLYDIFENALPKFTGIEYIEDLKYVEKAEFPYILNFNSRNEIRVYEAYNTHSQMMRRAICNSLGITDWNWKKNKKIDVIEKTIERWKVLMSR